MGTDELMHYGVQGMKWGIRRYQPYPDGSSGTYLGKKQAKRLVKTMNRNSYKLANAKYMLNKTNKKIAKYSYKGKKNKLTFEQMDADFHKKTIAKAEAAIKEAIDYLDKGGYTVSSKTKNKMMVDKGKAKVNALLGGGVGALILAPRREVTQYKAKEKKIYDSDDKNNALKPDLAESLSKAGLDDGDLQDINRAWQKANNANKKLEFKTENTDWGNYQTAKTKIGNREISVTKWDDNNVDDAAANQLVSHIKKDFGSIEKQLKEQGTKEIYDKYPAMRTNGIKEYTREQFKNGLKIHNIHVVDNNSVEISLWNDSKDDPMGGHSFDVEYDPKTKKIYGTSVNG